MQVAVFDDAEPEPSAALLGLASVPLGPLSEGVPVQAAFTLVHPVTGAAAGTVWVSIAWHDPLAAAAAGNALLSGSRVPMLDNTSAAAAAANAAATVRVEPAGALTVVAEETVGAARGDATIQALQAQLNQVQLQLQQHQQYNTQQQQQQQQQIGWPQVVQGPQLLASVPMLLSSPQQGQQLQPHMPGINPAAAAAVAAALGGQQQQVPLMWNHAPPGDPTSPFKGQDMSGRILMLQQGSPLAAAAAGSSAAGFNMRYGAATNLMQHFAGQQQLQASPMPPAAAYGLAPAQQQPQSWQHQQQQQQMVQLSQQQPQQQQDVGGVLRRVSTSADSWVNCDTTIYFRVEGLTLSGDGLADPAVRGRHVLLAHMLLEDFTSPVQQCTETAVADG
jgi:hypothetical protein